MKLRYTKITSWQDSEQDLRKIRHEVFVIGQQCPPQEEWDLLDPEAEHFLVKDADNQVYASARLVTDRLDAKKAKIGRFAVYPQFRGEGIGRQLVKYVIGFARSQGISELELSAQTYIQQLYAEFGFESSGEVYEEVGIPHIRMTLALHQRNTLPNNASRKDEQVHRFVNHQDYFDHLLSLLTQAQHKVLILSRDLEKGTLDHRQILTALSSLARKSRSTCIKIVTQDPKVAVTESNQLVYHYRRLPSSVEIKKLNHEIAFPDQVFVLVDGHGIILRHSHQSWEGFCCYSDPGTVKRLTEEFNRLLSYSEPSLELRSFSL